MRLGILGSGGVGRALASGFLSHGHAVMVGSRDPQKLVSWQKTQAPGAAIGTLAETAAFGDAVVLAVAGRAAANALRLVPKEAIAGKTVMDATNPIEAAPPDNGVLRYFSDVNRSLMEDLQEAFPEVRFVKAFSCVGAALMVDPDLPGGPPTMFICGNSEEARGEVTRFLVSIGWDVEDLGGAEAARAIEPLAMLWCIPGFRENRWTHAFRLLRG